MEPYQYQSLWNDKTDVFSIRLVVLSVGRKTEEITCSIIHRKLNERPPFEAVSYCWGDTASKSHIICDGKELLVPSTLIPFLQRTRAKGSERTLWIDSICINQEDKDEVASQVKMMREIYQKAMRTLIWLGPESDESTLGLDFAVKLYILFVKKEPVTRMEKLWMLYDNDVLNPFSRKWRAMLKILDRPWFTRAWVIQELVVSADPWIICGDRAMPWDTYAGAVFYSLYAENGVFEINAVRNAGIIIDLILSRSQFSHKKTEKHYEVLLRHRRASASNPLDYLFAFYGLTCRDHLKEDGVVPDYKITPENLYRSFAEAALTSSDNLDFLGIPRLPSQKNGLTLPSWVPDWSVSSPPCFSLRQFEAVRVISKLTGLEEKNRHPYYNATLESTCEQPIIIKDDMLRVHGYVIDTIATLSEPWILDLSPKRGGFVEQASVLQHNQSLLYDWVNVLDRQAGPSYRTDETQYDIMWQICIAGFPNQGAAATKVAFQQFLKRQRFLKLLHDCGLDKFFFVFVVIVFVERMLLLFGYRNPEMKYRQMVGAMLYRRAMQTADGGLGLAPGLAQSGDRVALLKGAKLPFILRDRGEYWELIGEAYIHGIMKGKAWTAEIERGNQCKELWIR